MSLTDLDIVEEASALTNSDLKGLLKAAKLTKYVSDSDGNSVPIEFEKSANLFDLVRSKIEDSEQSTDPDEEQESLSGDTLADTENVSEIEEIDTKEAGGNAEILTEKLIEEITSTDAILPTDSPALQLASAEEKDVIFSFDEENENTPTTDLETSDGSTDLKIRPHKDEATKKSYDEGYLAAKLEFEELLKAEKDHCQNLSETLFSISQTIVEATEEKLKSFILKTASKLAGEKIDELPEKYLNKISEILTEFSTNTDEIVVMLNKEDYAVVKKAKNFKDFLYSFDEDEALMRSEFKIKIGKLTSQVKFYEHSINDIDAR